MSVLASWSGEGLTDGTPVTTSTAGPGDTAFTTVTSGAFTVDDSGLHAPRLQVDQQAATEAQLIWDNGTLGTLSAHAVRVYVELSSWPGGNARLISVYDAVNTLQYWVDVTSAGILRLKDPSGVTVDSSDAGLPVHTELRLEVVADGTGAAAVTVYAGDGDEAIETLSGAGLGTTVEQIRFGHPNTSPTWPTLWLDEMAVADEATEIGPVPPPPEPEPEAPVFPDAPMKVDVELKIGDVWERVTGDVHTADPITIERGREDEASEASPSRLSLTLRSPEGRYSPRNPRSPYFGLIGRNTPIRVRVDHPDLPAPAPYIYMPGVTGHYLTTIDTAALDLTTDLDARIDITPDTWRPASSTVLAAKSDWMAGEDSWMLLLTATGVLRFRFTSDGFATARSADSTAAIPEDTGRCAVRVVFNASDPDHGNVRSYTFYTAPTLDGPWTQLGDVVTGPDGDHAIYSGSADLEIGSAGGGTQGLGSTRLFHGRVHGFQLADGDENVVADPGISALTEGTTAWEGPDALVWTLYGSARVLTGGPAHRFAGEVSEWPPRWSLGGHHQTVPIQAAGIKRRLGQGAPPVQSPLSRSIPVHPDILAYWPMEDGGGSFASGMVGHAPLRLTAGAASIAYAADDSFPGSAPLPLLRAGRAVAPVPAYSSPRYHLVSMLMHMQGEPEGPRQILRIVTTGSVATWDLWYSPADHSLAMTARDRDGVKVIDDTIANVPADGIVQQAEVRLEQVDGSTVWMTVVGLPLGTDATSQLTEAGTGTIGRISQLIVGDPNDLGDLAVGHIKLTTSPFTSIATLAFQTEVLGYPGETAAERLARLAGENNVPIQIIGELADTAPMGSQRVDTLLTLMQECAEADGGILGEARDEPGLLYRTRASLYNQPPVLELDYRQPGLAAPFEPVDDDQQTRNDVTATRPSGSSARVVQQTGPLSVQAPPGGVGTYDDSIEVNVATDDQLIDVAGWRVHLGTFDEARYPSLGVKLHKRPDLLGAAAAMDFGDRVTVTGMPPWLPPEDADALIQGYVEVIELLRWRIDANATPARPWRVLQLDTDGLDRVDTDASELAGAVDADTTSLSVATDGAVWTTDPGDLPLDVMIGGERVTVTAITGTSSPQTFTVVRAVNGITKAHEAGTAVVLADPVHLAR